jgi:AraC family transcriptional regulator
MLQAVEFIEAHLKEEISVADMAASVSFSLFHFSRTFSRVTRYTPYDYLMRRRLCEAARCLLESDHKIIDIAFEYQFNAPETFSRAFKRVFNLQPRQARLQQGFDQRRLVTKPTRKYLEFLNGDAPLKPAAKKMPGMDIAGIGAQINTADAGGTISDLWILLGQGMQSAKLQANERAYYGVRMYFPSYPAKRRMYLVGTILREGERAPTYFVEKNIPAMAYACFELPQQENAARFVRQYTYHTWWSKASNAPLAMFEIEGFSELPGGQARTKGATFPNSIYFPLPIE